MFRSKLIQMIGMTMGVLLFLPVYYADTQIAGAESTSRIQSPYEYVNKLDSDLSKARENQYNVLVPNAFSWAEQYLTKAKNALKRGQSFSEVIESVSRGQSELASAEKKAAIARSVLSDAIEARNLARAAGATEFTEDYAAAEESFLNLTRSVENDHLDWAKENQPRVSENYRELELRAIKEKKLGQVQKLLNMAERVGAKKKTPVTFAHATRELKEADSFISRERYQTEEIHKKANNALFMAQRLSQIMNLSENVNAMNQEQISLYIESMLQKITKKLSATDMRNEPIDVQIENIIGSINTLQNDHQFMVAKTKKLQDQITELKEEHAIEIGNMNRQIAALEGKTKDEQVAKARLEAEKKAAEERLTAERKFNELYIEVQNFFDQEEAEVYKQGNQLVIRLKDIKFPVGQSVIMPNNYQLLSKVQRSIRTFGEPDITIEGHTDSTGSDVTNELLSQQRAEAVREYLRANRTLSNDQIQAVGFGSKRPLASNATEEGRAINRRIDVIIKPKMQSR